ncbi:hypothetical protein DCS_02581 [Drechmeria coniospora]|uniref:Conserved oligomeric Golgi complex subunit 1 n=1 Tax=Drechmeria coniospora TaxID=98403 RepID=A0A151GWF8_DRECN|nr:hypothetical protein DCS_02581 [Drechmeria coniospora]KYK61439.1 hypothetical protein DCS_02581 [Drechmeria coniospora]
MASLPDTSTLTSSAQIFSTNHTLPQIRSIHKSLQVQIEEKSTRLRTQVGGSYRELLGTADTIVQMRSDNNRAQELLSKMGSRCGRAFLSSKATSLANFEAADENTSTGRAARLKLLDACGLVVGRILRGQGGLEEATTSGGRLVLAAKVWVLLRLLIKGLDGEGVDKNSARALVTASKSRDSLRRRLLNAIDGVLDKSDDSTERDDVLNALCAHSLVNSSGTRDALRHFLSVRAGAMALAFDLEENERTTTTEDVVRSLRLYTGTILDVQALVPAKLSPALAGLNNQKLLADSSLKLLEGLRLDLYGQWCSDEIQCFAPFIRHDDLGGSLARDMLSKWTEDGAQVLLHGLKKTLDQMADFKSITDLRTQVLQLWIRDGGRARGFDPSEMQDDLREAINTRMLAVLESKVTKLRLVGSEIRATLEGWREGVTDKHAGLWEEDGYDAALSNGAAPFVQEVLSRLYGRNDAVSKAIHSYSSWFHVIGDVKEVVEQLKKQRWDNDVDEVEDEETIEARQNILSKDDPQKLQDMLDTTLDKSFKDLEEQLAKLWRERPEGTTNSAVAMYLVRILREIRSQLPERPSISDFGLAMVPSLHRQIVLQVSAPALDNFSTNSLTMRTVPSRPLWEGELPLPSQPSPEIFQFLRALSLSMMDAGVDLWSASALAMMKKHLCERLCAAWQTQLTELPADGMPSRSGYENEADGDEKGVGNQSSDEKEDKSRRDDEENGEDQADEKGAESQDGNEQAENQEGDQKAASGQVDDEEKVGNQEGGQKEVSGQVDDEEKAEEQEGNDDEAEHQASDDKETENQGGDEKVDSSQVGDEEKAGNQEADEVERANQADKEHEVEVQGTGEKKPGEKDGDDGGKDDGLAGERVRDLVIQWLFDVSYLKGGVGSISGTASEDIETLREELCSRTGLDDVSLQRIGQLSQEYWRRTSLLFGLLA